MDQACDSSQKSFDLFQTIILLQLGPKFALSSHMQGLRKMAKEYKDNEDFLQWSQQLMADQTSNEFVPIPSGFPPSLPTPVVPLPPISTLLESLEMVPETIKDTLLGKVRGEMSKALADVLKSKMEEEKEEMFKELRETTENPEQVDDGLNSEESEATSGGGGADSQQEQDGDNIYPVGALNLLNLNFLKLVKKHLVFTNTWNKFFEKQWRERGDKMKEAIVEYHKKICKRFDIQQSSNIAILSRGTTNIDIDLTPGSTCLSRSTTACRSLAWPGSSSSL